jgi:hypothetical protein
MNMYMKGPSFGAMVLLNYKAFEKNSLAYILKFTEYGITRASCKMGFHLISSFVLRRVHITRARSRARVTRYARE